MDINIDKVDTYNESVLFEKLRQVTMLENPEVFPYEKAYMSLERLDINELAPAQLYVLKSEINKVKILDWELSKLSVDMLNLNGFARIHLTINNNKYSIVDLLPPIVEESIEKNGKIYNIINDGMHRCYLSYMYHTNPKVVFIRGISKKTPYYAYPIPNRNWDKIEILDSIPENYIKKWHRVENNKSLYRNFNSSFINVGGPRGYSSN